MRNVTVMTDKIRNVNGPRYLDVELQYLRAHGLLDRKL